MIRANGWGIAMTVTGGLLGGVSSYFLRLTDPQALMTLGAAWILFDGSLRLSRRGQTHWWLSRQAGGWLWYVPVWVFGLVIMLISAIVAFTA